MIDIVKRIRNILLTENVANISFDKFLLKNGYTDELAYILSDTAWMEPDTKFATRTTYAINGWHEYIRCSMCHSEIRSLIRPVQYGSVKHLFEDKNGCLCDKCRHNNPSKQSNKAKAMRWARYEKDSFLKERIAEVGEKFYDDCYIDAWAVDFKNTYGRKPTKEDFRLYFGRIFPRKSMNRHFNKELFSLWDSYLELKVCDYLNSIGYSEKYAVDFCNSKTDYVRNSMICVDGKYYQLDIFFPLISSAMEVEDFTTHSRTSDTEPYKQRADSFKHGPTYHAAKRTAAEKCGIILIELWEDNIRNGTFKEMIDIWLNPLI